MKRLEKIILTFLLSMTILSITGGLLFFIALKHEKAPPPRDLIAIDDATAEEIQSLIDDGYDVNKIYYRGYHIVSKMILNEHDDIVALLIKAGLDASTIKVKGEKSELLHRAAFNNHPAIAQILIEAGADIEAKDDDDRTTLHDAAIWGGIDVMRVLLQAGADPNARSKYGNTVFMYAVGHAFLPDWDEGKEFNHETKTYEYPNYDERLVEGEQSLIDGLAMVKLLIDYGADPHAVNHNGNNARGFLRGDGDAPEVKKYLDELGVK